jgi:hypothetical protein
MTERVAWVNVEDEHVIAERYDQLLVGGEGSINDRPVERCDGDRSTGIRKNDESYLTIRCISEGRNQQACKYE